MYLASPLMTRVLTVDFELDDGMLFCLGKHFDFGLQGYVNIVLLVVRCFWPR